MAGLWAFTIPLLGSPAFDTATFHMGQHFNKAPVH